MEIEDYKRLISIGAITHSGFITPKGKLIDSIKDMTLEEFVKKYVTVPLPKDFIKATPKMVCPKIDIKPAEEPKVEVIEEPVKPFDSEIAVAINPEVIVEPIPLATEPAVAIPVPLATEPAIEEPAVKKSKKNKK